jgi:pimeloyl-ACP methyl ester carboxylesterase
MPYATTDDGVKLYYEVTGSGKDLIFVHEFGGDYRSWEPQVRHFSRHYRCITFNARGWPPSDVPKDVSAYSQKRAVEDLLCVLDAVKSSAAHVVGLSMGGFATLHFGLTHPDRALSLCVAGCGYGAEPDRRAAFSKECENIAAMLLDKGMSAFVERYAEGPTRVQFQNKDPRGFAEFKAMFKEHSALGSANTQLGVQRERPSLYDLTDQMKQLRLPTLIVNGDEDWSCLMPGLLMKQTIPHAALVVFPNVGHTINLEVPDAWNRELADFLSKVDSGKWPARDPRTISSSVTGMGD